MIGEPVKGSESYVKPIVPYIPLFIPTTKILVVIESGIYTIAHYCEGGTI